MPDGLALRRRNPAAASRPQHATTASSAVRLDMSQRISTALDVRCTRAEPPSASAPPWPESLSAKATKGDASAHRAVGVPGGPSAVDRRWLVSLVSVRPGSARRVEKRHGHGTCRYVRLDDVVYHANPSPRTVSQRERDAGVSVWYQAVHDAGAGPTGALPTSTGADDLSVLQYTFGGVAAYGVLAELRRGRR